MEHRVLCQPQLHFLHALKYNTLPNYDIVMVNDWNTIIQPNAISYSPMRLAQVPTIWDVGGMFCQRTMQ